MTRPGHSPLRVRQAHVEWVQDRLSTRDLEIIRSIARLRLITGVQLERLHFHDLTGTTRSRRRRRVLARLVAWRVLQTLDRRVGGVRAGSAGLVYALDSTGVRLLNIGETTTRLRREAPSIALLGHTLGIAELYVMLVELARLDGFQVDVFATEPGCWWQNGLGGFLKPDAHLVLTTDTYRDAWWLEQDTGSESLPVLARKLRTYLDFVHRGGHAPSNLTPRVLLSLPSVRRAEAVQALIQKMPEPAGRLFYVTTHEYAARVLTRVLRE